MLFSYKCRDFYRELAKCSKCDYVFGFNDEGAKWDTFLRHYNKHNKHVTKNMSSREEIDEEVTASLVTLPLSQPAPASSSALTQENRVTMEDAEDTVPSREPLELGSKLTRKKTTREEIDEEGTASLVSLPLSKSAPTPAPAPEVNIRVGQILFLFRVFHFPGRNRL